MKKFDRALTFICWLLLVVNIIIATIFFRMGLMLNGIYSMEYALLFCMFYHEGKHDIEKHHGE